MTRRSLIVLPTLALLLVSGRESISADPKANPGQPANNNQARVDRHGDPLPPGALARLGTVRFRHAASSAAYSPDGKILATGGSDNQIRLFEAATGKEIRRLAGHQPRTFSPPRVAKSPFDLLVDSVGAGNVTTLAFSPDGKILASGGWDDMVRLWDVDSGKEVRKMLAHQAMVARLVFSADGKTLASRGGIDGILRLWDPQTGVELRKVENLSKVNPWRFYREVSLAFAPDSKTLAVSDRTAIILIDAASGKETGRWLGYRDCMFVTFSPDGKLLASGGLDDAKKESYSLRLWDVGTGQEVRRCELPKTRKGGTEPPTGLAFSPQGDKLAAAIAEMDTYLFDVANGKQLQRFNHYWAYRVAYSPDGKTMLSVRGPALRLWNPADGKERFENFAGHQAGVQAVAVSPDGKLVASGGENIRIWEMAGGKLVRKLAAPAASLAFSPDGKTLASGGGRSIHLWDAETGNEIRKFDGPRLLRSVVFSPDGKVLASGDEQAVIRFWDLEKGSEIRHIDGHALAESLSLAYSRDGKSLACAGAWNQFGLGNIVLNLQGRVTVKGRSGYKVVLWDAQTGQETRTFAGLKDNIKSVAFSPDGKTLAASSRDGRIVLWNAATGEERLHIMAHPAAKAPGTRALAHLGGAFAATPALCFTPDGKTLISAGPDRTIRLWDTITAKELGQFQAPDAGFSALAITRDGTRLVSASPDSTVMVWDIKAAGNLPEPKGQPKVITIGD